MRKTIYWLLCCVAVWRIATSVSVRRQEGRLPEYLQAEKFTKSKLNKMLFSTTVDPHWFQQGNSFWFEYKTSEGTFWFVVDPFTNKKVIVRS